MRPRIKTKVGKPRKHTPLEMAQAAVMAYEEERGLYEQMKEDFKDNFPDACAALDHLKFQEDKVMDAVKNAHPLVQAARETVGDFTCTPKWSKPKYDASAVTGIIKEAGVEDALDMFAAFLESGIIKKIDFTDAATAVIAAHPDLSKVLEPAFKDKTPLTASVVTPKL